MHYCPQCGDDRYSPGTRCQLCDYPRIPNWEDFLFGEAELLTEEEFIQLMEHEVRDI